jgi:hypothetical protein
VIPQWESVRFGVKTLAPCQKTLENRGQPVSNAMRRSKFLQSLAAFVAVGFSLVHANPMVRIEPDPTNRKVQMIAENVSIDVEDSYSIVTGQYRFKQLPEEDVTTNGPTGQAYGATHVTIVMPVFLPAKKSGLVAGVEESKIEIRLNNQIYKPVSAQPIDTYDNIKIKKLPKLPDDWKMVGFVVNISLDDIDNTFELAISYRQPHFGGMFGRYSAYCAMISRPADASSLQPADFSVSFEPAKRISLTLITRQKPIVTKSKNEIAVHPEVGLDDIVVRVR